MMMPISAPAPRVTSADAQQPDRHHHQRQHRQHADQAGSRPHERLVDRQVGLLGGAGWCCPKPWVFSTLSNTMTVS